MRNKDMQNITPLIPGQYYHIYNHANGSENFFIENRDYENFLYRYQKYIVPICETFAYCLMPNHFHFFVQIKPETELEKTLKINLETHKVDNATISYRFSHFFNGYTQFYNTKYERKGALFNKSFKRKPVNTDKYFVKLVHYIHTNPVKDKMVKEIEKWEYSSYNTYLSQSSSFLNEGKLFDYFGDIDNFKLIHEESYKFE